VGYRHSNLILQEHGNKLWLGDYSSAEDIEQLRVKNIRTGIQPIYEVITAAQGYYVAYDGSVVHHSFDLQDVKAQNIMQYFDEATKKIAAGRILGYVGLRVGSVLVHCAAGVSRVYHYSYVVGDACYRLPHERTSDDLPPSSRPL